jgi:hypothetical protein
LQPDVTLLVGELREGGHYNSEHEVSPASLFELYRFFPGACHLDFYLARVAEMSRVVDLLE